MRICITGSQGFVGHHLYRLLESYGHLVVGIDKVDNGYSQKLVKTDLMEPLNIDGFDVVIHLACDVGASNYISDKASQYSILSNNVQMDLNVVGACKRSKTKIVYFSSSCVYDGDTTYGTSKTWGEKLIIDSGLKYIIVRPQNIYGPEDYIGNHKEKVQTAFFKKALTQKKLEIWGDGKSERSFIYVKDICEWLHAMIKLGEEGIFDKGGNYISMNDLAKLVLQIAKKDIPITHTKKTIGTKEKFRMNFEPTRTSLEKGLKEVHKWIKKSL